MKQKIKKKRAKTHISQLMTQEQPNQELQADFEKYGPNYFEFVIVLSGTSVSDFTYRKSEQDNLIQYLNSKAASYTTGLTETTQPRFAGEYPSQSGVFYICCLENDHYYFGHTQQTLGIGGRVRSIKDKLTKGTFENSALQKDWDLYGEDSFEFVPYVYGDNYVDEITRIKVVNQLIYETYTADPSSLYNTHFFNVSYKPTLPLTIPLPTDLTGPLPPQQFYIPRPFFSFKPDLNKFPDGKVISLVTNIPIYAEGAIYLSISEAAKCFGVNFKTIEGRLTKKQPGYREATAEEVFQELERRGWSTSIEKAVFRPDKKKSTKGVPRPIVVDRKWYPTIEDAGRAYNLSANSVRKWPNTGYHKAFFPRDYPNGKHPNKDWNPPEDGP